MELLDYRVSLNRLIQKRESLTESREREQKALDKAGERGKAIEQAQAIIQQIAKSLQERTHGHINRIVTLCLNAVFDEPYTFQFRFDKKRGKTEAYKVFYRDGLELDDPLNEVGGGVIDITSFAFRIAYILLSHPPKRRFIALDESFKCVRGEDYKKRTRRMLQLLAEKKGFQFIINTDIPEYRLGKIIEIE